MTELDTYEVTTVTKIRVKVDFMNDNWFYISSTYNSQIDINTYVSITVSVTNEVPHILRLFICVSNKSYIKKSYVLVKFD